MIIIVSKSNLKIPVKDKEIKDCDWVDFNIEPKTYSLATSVFALDIKNNIVKVLKDRYDLFGKYERYSDFNRLIESVYHMENTHSGKGTRKLR